MKRLLDDNNSTFKVVKNKLGHAEGFINNSTNLKLISMEIPFTPLNVEKLSSPTFYAFMMDVAMKIEKSPLYQTTMRSNLAAKMVKALQLGNESVVLQLRLAGVDIHDHEKITAHLISKFGGALRTQSLAISHHLSHERISFPLESTIIGQQLECIKQHLKAFSSIKDMVLYMFKTKSKAEAMAVLQAGGYTEKYLRVLNEALPVLTQSANIDRMEMMSHQEGFEMLEHQLLELHKSAQRMQNRYCIGTGNNTLLVTNNTNTVEKKTALEDAETKKMALRIEELEKEQKIQRNRNEREVKQLMKLLEEAKKGIGGEDIEAGSYGCFEGVEAGGSGTAQIQPG